MKRIIQIEVKTEKLISILAKERIGKEFEKILKQDKKYQIALKEQQRAAMEVERIDLSKKQFHIIDELISSVNYCSSLYGDIAYEQGLKDGVRLVSEIEEIKEL